MKKSSFAVNEVKPETFILKETKHFPNNSSLPLLYYPNVLDIEDGDAEAIEDLFTENNWHDTWRSGIYKQHHYHSTAHEVLGISQGFAKVQFGGPNGIIKEVHKGDVVVIPAGVAHKNLSSSPDFACVGAYPKGQHYDMNYGEENERPYTDEKIKEVKLPESDPIYGKHGDLLNFWS